MNRPTDSQLERTGNALASQAQMALKEHAPLTVAEICTLKDVFFGYLLYVNDEMEEVLNK